MKSKAFWLGVFTLIALFWNGEIVIDLIYNAIVSYLPQVK